MRIGIDIDGVLADFNPAYIALLNEVSGKMTAPVDYQPTQWSYEGDLGFTPEQVKEAWKRIGKSEDFWRQLNPLATPAELDRVGRLGEEHEVYFITARPGTNVKLQTEFWLENEGIPCPTVLISSEKGMCCAALNLEVYIDDKFENIVDVEEKSPFTRAYLLNRPYNSGRLQLNGVTRRADTLEEVFEREVI